MAKISKISGFPEWLPEHKLAEDKVISTIRGIYESFGFSPIETPAVELLSSLGSKGVIDKEIFVVKRLRADEAEEAELGLHFDLTVPFARYVAQHNNALTFPFKRYQLQKVWRGDRPQKGRFREFYQFDIDIIARNELPLSCDAEVLTVIGLVMNKLNFGSYSIRINNRKLLQGLYQALGLDEQARKSAIIAVDKILKIGRDGVAKELERIEGISPSAIESILNSTAVQCPIEQLAEKVQGLNLQSEFIHEGVQELIAVCELLPASVRSRVTIDLSLARGLDYYTGLIMELGLDRYPEFGTVVAGGRYENLAAEFCDQKLPGVGVSLGLSRLMELVIAEKLVETTRKTPTQALVTVLSESDRVLSNEVAQALRDAGLPTEVFYRSPKLGKQIDYADAKGIRYVIFADPATREVQVKDLATKEQVAIPCLATWARGIVSQPHG
jgi:histidyl-tRNA synthetase